MVTGLALSAGAAGCPHPGYLHAGRAAVLTVVVFLPVIGSPADLVALVSRTFVSVT
jgi:hypothetical protein